MTFSGRKPSPEELAKALGTSLKEVKKLMTLSEVGQAFGLSAERIRQIEKKFRNQLWQQMKAKGLVFSGDF